MTNPKQENPFNRNWYEKLVLPLTLLAAAGCSESSDSELSRDIPPDIPKEARFDAYSRLIAVVEEAFILGGGKVEEEKPFVQCIPVEFHLSSLISANIGKLSLSVERNFSDSFLVLDVASEHALFPSIKVGIQVEDVVQVRDVQGREYIALKFIGKEDEDGSCKRQTIIFPLDKSDSFKLDIHADVDLTSMEGTLHKIDASFTDFQGKNTIIRITGDPTQRYLDLSVISGRSDPTPKFPIKRKRYF